MKNFTLAIFLFFPFSSAFSQSPFKPQLVVPVYFDYLQKPVSNTEKQPGNVVLSGISLMFIDTTLTQDEIIITGHSELVIWHDYVGKSNKVAFVIPDTQMIGRLELTYFDGKCGVQVWRQDRQTGDVLQAKGNLMLKDGGYVLHLVADEKTRQGMTEVFERLNIFLMHLHTVPMRKVAVKSWFDYDSLNVIIGADTQFNTDNELFWFNQQVRSRIGMLASSAYSRLVLLGKNEQQLRDSLNGTKLIVHEASSFDDGIPGVKGTISILMKPDDKVRYLFFKPEKSYRIFVEYSFRRGKSGPGELSIDRFGLRNQDTGDFVEMEVYDLVNSGFPVLYVDLIRGVVMEDGGPWDVSNVIHAIEDVFEVSKLPYE